MNAMTASDLARAVELCKKFSGVNIATLQRKLAWGYNFSCAVVEELQRQGVLGDEKNSRHDACGAIYPLIGELKMKKSVQKKAPAKMCAKRARKTDVDLVLHGFDAYIDKVVPLYVEYLTLIEDFPEVRKEIKAVRDQLKEQKKFADIVKGPVLKRAEMTGKSLDAYAAEVNACETLFKEIKKLYEAGEKVSIKGTKKPSPETAAKLEKVVSDFMVLAKKLEKEIGKAHKAALATNKNIELHRKAYDKFMSHVIGGDHKCSCGDKCDCHKGKNPAAKKCGCKKGTRAKK